MGNDNRSMSALLQFVAFRNTAIPVTDAGTAPDHYWNGLPFEADGRLAVDNGGLVDHYWQGLGFTSVGRLSASLNGVLDHFGMGAAAFNTLDQLIYQFGAVNDYANGIPYSVDERFIAI